MSESLTVEAALAELRELLPGSDIQVASIASVSKEDGDDVHHEVVVDDKNFCSIRTLRMAVEKVREWAKSPEAYETSTREYLARARSERR